MDGSGTSKVIYQINYLDKYLHAGTSLGYKNLPFFINFNFKTLIAKVPYLKLLCINHYKNTCDQMVSMDYFSTNRVFCKAVSSF